MGTIGGEKTLTLWETITLGSPRAQVVVFSFGLLFLSIIPTEKLGPIGRFCFFQNFIFPLILGQKYNCPGCGLTHAISRLMHYDFWGAYQFNKLIIVVFPLIIFLIIFNLFRWVKLNPV